MYSFTDTETNKDYQLIYRFPTKRKGLMDTYILVVGRRGKVGVDGIIFTMVGAMDLIL